MTTAPGLMRFYKARDARILSEFQSGISVQEIADAHELRVNRVRTILHRMGAVMARTQTLYTLADIIAVTAGVFGVTPQDLRRRTRVKTLNRPRQCVALICRCLGRATYPQIGRALNRHHTTIMNSYEQGQYLFDRDPEFANKVLAVVVRLQPAGSIRYELPDVLPTPVVKAAPIMTKPKPEPEAELDDMSALSLAVQRHYAAGRDCLEVY